MMVFVIAMLLVLAGTGSYAYFNQDMTDVRWWHWHWYAVPDWWPIAAAIVAMGLLLVFQMGFAATFGGRARVSRRMAAHDAAIDELRRRNMALQDEVARLGGEPSARREMA
ncbi:MAG: hypothetical protein ACREPI_03695 [Candidatus Dormibacterales bacterium]